ncbi:MAG: amidohydrolase family protein, partial [Bacteroidales bacterium]|nr:amidohydrolase family protein [Bacteroidales bacterium]
KEIKSTTEIGNCTVLEINSAFGPKSVIGQSDYYKNCDLFGFTVIQMMDMEYAWLSGFDGLPIYFEDETPWYYYERENSRDPKEKWKKVLLPGENQKTFAKWENQLNQTKKAMKLSPLRLIGMYHYDPRRWNFTKTQVFDNVSIKGAWSYPFNEIISATGKGLFIGFKMYPPLGYKPLDLRLPYLHDKLEDGDCFYGRCEREGIPILAHCSPGGMSTHEMKLYMQYDGRDRKPATDEEMPEETRKRLFSPEGYFWTNYVHPRAWREVLFRFPKLKLCLAHFGGDEWKRGLDSDWITEIIALTKEYSNVYTDFSCWDIHKAKESFAQVLGNRQNAHLKNKILFGTDWYMTLLALGGKSYKKFCEEFWEFFQGIPDGKDLWQRFTFLNPFTFYGFFDKKDGAQGDKLDNLVAALKKNECDKDKLNDNYPCIRRVQKEYDKLKSQEGK